MFDQCRDEERDFSRSQSPAVHPQDITSLKNTMKLFISALASLLLICPTTLALPSDLAIRQATNGPHPATIIWVCAGNLDPAMDIPDVCKNMCYGAYCRNFGTTLTWDNYTGNTKAARDANAGCERNSHCTDDLQCNVYPFDSTCDADRTDRISVNRCIPSGQNARECWFRTLF